jgi:hypothetical protein
MRTRDSIRQRYQVTPLALPAFPFTAHTSALKIDARRSYELSRNLHLTNGITSRKIVLFSVTAMSTSLSYCWRMLFIVRKPKNSELVSYSFLARCARTEHIHGWRWLPIASHNLTLGLMDRIYWIFCRPYATGYPKICLLLIPYHHERGTR